MNRLLAADFNQYNSGNWDKTAGIDFSSMMGNGTDPSTAYDENGNIRGIYQVGWQLGGSTPIDSLAYSYNTNSNQLKNVIDGRNNPQTTLGDFRTSSLSPYSTGKTNAAVDYSYDVNGNLTRDLNKDIGSSSTDGITYNHLNLPWRVTVRSATGTKGTITYIYDAAGTKLQKRTGDSAGSLVTVTDYMGSFQYQGKSVIPAGGAVTLPADTLQFLGQEEGRVRVSPDSSGGQSVIHYLYDYFLKDHLGNTRLVLTEEQSSDKYPAATMETAASATEDLYYSGIEATRSPLPSGYPNDTTTHPNQYAAKVNAAPGGNKIGPSMILKVMAGDQFSIRASSWYRLNGATPGAPANPLSDVVTSLISGIGNLPGGGHPGVSALQANSAPLNANVTQFLQDTGSSIVNSRPHAFLNWILLDNQFNYVSASSGFDQVGGDQEFKKHILVNLPVSQSGYLYIYVSNETPNVDVFFDNLQVTRTRGAMLEETHYYPFGLSMAGISDKALKPNYAENKYRFQKQEFQNKEFSDGSGLEMYEFKYRFEDNQTGRFWSIDPLAEKYVYNSIYAFSEDKVTTHIELEGLEAEYIFDKAKQELAQNIQAFSNWLDRAVSFFSKTSTSTVVTSTPLTTTSVGTTVTTSTSTNAGGNMNYIIAHNTNEGNPESVTKTTTTVSADTKTDITTPKGAITQKNSVDNNGVATSETGVKVNTKIDGAPITLSTSLSTSTDGQKKVTIQGGIGPSSSQVTGQVQYSTSDKHQGVSIGVGGQQKAGNTTVTTIFGIKIN